MDCRELGESSYSIKKQQSFLLHFFCYHLLHLHIQTQQHKETSPWTGATLLQNVLVENNYVELILCIILSFSRKTPVYWCSQSPESYRHYFMWVMFSVCRILCYPSFKCFVSNSSPKVFCPSVPPGFLLITLFPALEGVSILSGHSRAMPNPFVKPSLSLTAKSHKFGLVNLSI